MNPGLRSTLLHAVFGPAMLAGLASGLQAQATGAINGRVTDRSTGQGVAQARIELDNGGNFAVTDSAGNYRVRAVQSGWHRVSARFIGYRGEIRDSVLVRAGLTTIVNFELRPAPAVLEDIIVSAVDTVLDPLAVGTTQRISAAELRNLPVSSLEEALQLQAGAVGESYRGGRLGQESFILDGLGVKNQLDASTGGLGVRLPPDILEEASLTTNAFSARYGQALSGLVNVVTKDGGTSWEGRTAYETDRPLGNGWDHGLDRLVAEADGPLFGGIGLLVGVDASSRIDADPVSAPASGLPRDPRNDAPWLLPHNSGEQYDFAGKLTVPLGVRNTLRIFGLRSVQQRLLYDPVYKYDEQFAPGQRLTGTLLNAQMQSTLSVGSTPLIADIRLGYFDRDFFRGTLIEQPDPVIGAFTGKPFHFVGEDIARAQDTLTAAGIIPGLTPPELSSSTPWGVPAFFQGGASNGDVAWNHYREYRTQLDMTWGAGQGLDLYFGGQYSRQDVKTFQRVLGFLPAADSVPPPTASSFKPNLWAAYIEGQARVVDLAFTAGIRADHFDAGSDLTTPSINQGRFGSRTTVSPRIAVSTVLSGATLVASFGKFSQPPDLQYLVDAAFDDTTRTGRFRRGNPDLGFEKATQYEFSLRIRPASSISARLGLYSKRLDGLVSSVPLGVDPDSTIFALTDYGSVRGLELILEREMRDWWGVRLLYTLQKADATSTNAFGLRQIVIDPITGDTTNRARVEFPLDFDRRHSLTAILQARIPGQTGPRILGVRPLEGLELASIIRYNSGLPYSRTDATGDSIIGPPNDGRLPSNSTVDLLIRRPFRLVGGTRAGIYLDIRNLFNRRNVLAVRRDTGTPGLDDAGVQQMATTAYNAHPEPIPYESPRYRRWADTDQNGYVDGPAELLPLYLSAARDFTQPIFAYGAPRLVRLGMEVLF
ncbi:MAG: carboxypeptidase regulatory-like domain-containing protein [Gemmatimonadales bacterium]